VTDDPTAPTGPADLDRVYAGRFDDAEARAKRALWRPIVEHLGRWIDPSRPVLDIACDRGDFIANVTATERWATDVRDASAYQVPGVRFVRADGRELAAVLPVGTFGTVFMSNYLEHLPSPDAVIEQLRVARELLAPGGRLLVIQPNIRLTGAAYWDFIDHRTPLTERSLIEAGGVAGLETEALVVRFLPYTTKGVLPTNPTLVRLYLRLPIAWRVLGRQTLWVARRS
jgi:SAM-dependent methyltransferase